MFQKLLNEWLEEDEYKMRKKFSESQFLALLEFAEMLDSRGPTLRAPAEQGGADSFCPECGARLNFCMECEKRVTPRPGERGRLGRPL